MYCAVLYRDGPPFYHGSYSVVVKMVDDQGRPLLGHGQQRQFSWTLLAGLKRITEHVGKVQGGSLRLGITFVT